LFRTKNDKDVKQTDAWEGEMFLPSMQEYLVLFDRFALGGDLANQIGASYPLCRGAFENSFLGLYYTLRWYSAQ
jgi:hypothetical protein